MQEAQQITLLGLPFSPSPLPPPLPQTPAWRTPAPPRPLHRSKLMPPQSAAGAAPLCCTSLFLLCPILDRDKPQFFPIMRSSSLHEIPSKFIV